MLHDDTPPGSMFGPLPDPNIPLVLRPAHAQLMCALDDWINAVSEYLAGDSEDIHASRHILICAQRTERRRAIYDRLNMGLLPPDRGMCDDEYCQQLFTSWQEVNKVFGPRENLLRMTRPGGDLDQVWRLCGQQLLET